MGGDSFSTDWNYPMTTIVNLKNEIRHAITPTGVKAQIHCKIDQTRADHSTMFDAKPNIPMGTLKNKQALSAFSILA